MVGAPHPVNALGLKLSTVLRFPLLESLTPFVILHASGYNYERTDLIT
jgi:hypothetical protein